MIRQNTDNTSYVEGPGWLEQEPHWEKVMTKITINSSKSRKFNNLHFLQQQIIVVVANRFQ